MIDVHEIKLFQEELRNGATLNEVLVKYGLSLKDALKIARLNKSHQIWCTDYIFMKGNIRFTINFLKSHFCLMKFISRNYKFIFAISFSECPYVTFISQEI